MVKDIAPGGASSFPAVLGSVGGAVLFHALWRTDGTAAGTELVADIQLGFESVFANGAFYFPADDGVHGRELWKSDGTSAGTVMVADLNPGPDSSDPQHLAALNGTVYFAANDGVHTELWKSDGTSAGTVLVSTRVIDSSLEGSAANVDGTLFFSSGGDLWKSDGTTAGTVLVRDITPGPADTDFLYSESLAVLGNTVFFATDDLLIGEAVWKSDGTEGGTVILKEAAPVDSFVSSPVAVGAAVVFGAWDEASGEELWATDGTADNTHKVAEIVPGSGASSPHGFAASGSLLFFNAFTNETGRELFAVPIAALMDSDLDGLDYASEAANGTDPFDADSDDDDLTDGAELLTHGTDPLDGDSDGDGYGDGTEVAVGTDPLDPQGFPPAVPLVGPWGLGVLAALLLACARPRRRA